VNAERVVRKICTACWKLPMTKVRADQLLVTRGLFESRARAQAAIESGLVTAGGIQVKKPAQPVPSDAELTAEAAHPYVSRGGVKLAAALAHFDFNPDGKNCLDVGASTGGFTDVLLRHGARRVFAVDVGSGQLHPSLKSNPAVIQLENIDARALDSKVIHPPAELITIDVSFISLKLIIPSRFGFCAGRRDDCADQAAVRSGQKARAQGRGARCDDPSNNL
jgi:23S rRNA (cytidine1920-2'-O)/16S rRNA (cytidine1409-2'-O)-methyltransferase